MHSSNFQADDGSSNLLTRSLDQAVESSATATESLKPGSTDDSTWTHWDNLAPGLVAVAFVILAALVWDAFTATPASAAAPQRGTVAYCKANAAGVAERACIVRVVFAPVGQSRKAVRVFYCESRLDPRAANGQYRGVAQMGAAERRRYGHGPTTEAQARAALRYYRVAGWRPWACA